MKTTIKPYTVNIITSNHEYIEESTVGHFIKEPYFVIERENGERIMFLNDSIDFIEIAKEWQNED